MKRISLIRMVVLVLLAGAFAFAQNPVRVGSKQFTENIVLGQLIVLALEDAGIEVEDRTNLGSTQVNRAALENAEIDVYPEYTGTAITNFFREADVDIPVEASGNAEQSFAIVSELDLELNNLVWLERAPANNTYAIVVTREFSESEGLTSAEDLAEFVNAGNYVFLATGDEFAQRPDGIPAFESTYGFEFAQDQLLIIAGGTPAQTQQALATGANNVNMAMAYGTDGELVAYDFVVLEDPSGAQPVFQPSPVFRASVLEDYPNIPDILNPIFALLDAPTLQELNARVAVDGESESVVARDFLQENGFID